MAPPPPPPPAHPNDPRHPDDIPPHEGVINPYPIPVIGPHPSHIQVAKPYLWEQQIQILLGRLGGTREIEYRLHGVQLIDAVRSVLSLPVNTFSHACVYYHKFRLLVKDTEYQYETAAIAALFLACKAEDTLKKSKEIICAAHNMKVATIDALSPDDPVFERTAIAVIGIERLMLECSGFDFRSRYPHKQIVKVGNLAELDRALGEVAWCISIDMYKTFIPLKKGTSTMAFACLELAARIKGVNHDKLDAMYVKMKTDRERIMEALLDLVELYTHHQKSTIVGPQYDVDVFIQLRIALNKESQEKNIPRYMNWNDDATRNNALNLKTPQTPITPASPAAPVNGRDGILAADHKSIGARGSDGTVRFMLDAEMAKQEKATVDKYYTVEYEEFEVEVEVDEPIAPAPRSDRGLHGNHRGRDDRFHGGGGYHGRRGRR